MKVRGTGSYEESFVASFSFDGYNCIEQFCNFLFRDKTNRNSTVIAHNGGGYDNKFILNWAVKHGIYPSKYIRQGSKITYKNYRANNLRFIDSLSFVARHLRDFPEVFGITEDVKGYFPPHFNTPENPNYIGPIPDKHFTGLKT